MKKARLVAVAFGLLLSTTTAQAQFHDPNDFGVTDTLDMVFSVVPRAATSQLKVQIDLWVLNDSNNVGSAAAGFKWINTNLRMDSARFSAITLSGFDFARFTYEGGNINTTNTNRRFPFVGARSFEPGVLFGPSRRIWCRYYFTLTSWSINDSIVLDTNAYNTGVTYKFVDDALRNYRAYWTGKKVIHDPDYVPPSTLAVSKDTLFYTAVYGQPGPPSQSFVISSSPNSVPFTVTENAPWILKSPSLGNTPATITVSMNVTALSIGAYFDSVIVESNNAVNSPRVVYVKLNVVPPPPTIKVTPLQLFFSAVVAGANPLPKDLIIKNSAGGSVLNWTLSKSQPWLSVAPLSGTDSNTVIVSVDIAGLGFGTFKDTIVVSDPAASNNPVKVPVFLQMGSNLPIIVADSQYNFFVMQPGGPLQFSKFIDVRNGGAGPLEFRVSESSTRIFSLLPDTATAPQQIEVQYKMSGQLDGMIYTDTFWVTSEQAINSPYPVVITLRFVDNPAQIGLSPDTIKFSVFECAQGLVDTLPWKTLSVENVGQDDPMVIKLAYQSELFTINKDSAVAPSLFKVFAANPDVPVGTYYDTIVVVATNATNTPRMVIVQYERLAGQQAPQIVAVPSTLTIPYLEESGPSDRSALQIYNLYGGCMPWTIEEDIPWITPFVLSGNVHGGTAMTVDAPGYTLGRYPDTLYISSPGAVNSPVILPLELRVWKFKCDVDWDGVVDIADITSLIAFEYFGGDSPMPTYLVGDCDCDNLVDIADLTRLIDYLYFQGGVICGNPF